MDVEVDDHLPPGIGDSGIVWQGRVMASGGGATGYAKLWDVDSTECVKTLSGHTAEVAVCHSVHLPLNVRQTDTRVSCSTN